MIYVYLAAGGVAGTFARFWMTGWVGVAGPGAFPWGTLLVNVLGSLTLGLVLGATAAGEISPELRLALTVGLCGAFTTFSTMSYETVVLLQAGDWVRAGAYALGGLVLGLAAVLVGLHAARILAA